VHLSDTSVWITPCPVVRALSIIERDMQIRIGNRETAANCGALLTNPQDPYAAPRYETRRLERERVYPLDSLSSGCARACTRTGRPQVRTLYERLELNGEDVALEVHSPAVA